ncbi:cysteine-rich repeat secretory protein 38-like [Cornus florida]|uniref:cysteine-rich repeat secretory protein 38-like n=1 Tax=Cornus florida TaxID=4283 RepID=UPI00289DEBBA|nr:cysteine-rich repeat secretory protein 38-like [Cornus florida]
MASFHLKPTFVVFIASTFILSYSFCHADSNLSRGSLCAQADNSTVGNSFQTNLNNIFHSLASNGPLNSCFYKTTAGKGSNKIYGFIQCRGDISARDCANCTGGHTCPKSKEVTVWFRWCFLRYSDEKFFGVSEPTRVTIFDNNDVDDPSVVSKGFSFMGALASTTPNQPLMFQTSVLEEGGKNETRYGMAQCTRDFSRSECGKCLNTRLVNFKDIINSNRRWEIYGMGCSMWYHDYQFYYNISTTASAGARKSGNGVVVGIPAFLMFTYLVVL